MKRVVIGFAVCCCLGGFADSASAATFADTIDFTGSGTNPTYVEIKNDYSYTHTLSGLTTPPHILESANLSLRHNGNSDNSGEIWFSYQGTQNLKIGQLTNSTESNDWVIDTWTLSTAILNLMDDGNPWSLNVDLKDDTTGTDKLQIDYSTISGTYSTNPVPVPGAAWLLGSGLLGLAGLGRKKKAAVA